MEGRLTTAEGQRLLRKLYDEGRLGELLLSEAAAALLDSPEKMASYLSPEEIWEFEELRRRILSTSKGRVKSYALGEEGTIGVAAEESASYE